jgi:enoyl-CoA hydratase
MNDVLIRKEGRAGRITLNRPKALNALTWQMCLAVEAALDSWRDDAEVALVMIDGAGERAFCAGGDIAEMYASAQRGDESYGQDFWRDEYRLNRKLHHYAKPIVSFLHGFTMGGGVGLGCHASHRIVCDDSRLSMPECGIGLVPDVGGSLLLAQAPGRLGEYLGLTGARMGPGDAIYAGFADHYLPQGDWADVIAALIASGDTGVIPRLPPPASALAQMQDAIDVGFASDDLAQISAHAAEPEKALARNAPLAMAVTLRILAAVRADPRIETALDHEYRYTFRSLAQGDFIEGIRAAIIDRDRNPRWRDHTPADIATMTAPLGQHALIWEDDR